VFIGYPSNMARSYAKRFALSRAIFAVDSTICEALRIHTPKRMIKPRDMTPKNPAAVELGRRGGKARVRNQTPEQRAASARNAAQARWSKNQEFIDQKLAELEKKNAKPKAHATQARRSKVGQDKKG
jgi:hypothetical protein